VAGSRRALAIRIALGASDRDVRRLVLGGAARLLAIGIILGVALSLAGDRLLQAFVSGARSSDPRSIAMAAVVLCAVAAVAVLAPARRASRTSPIDALHPE
jgi:putative ABC transport system permease protein